MDTGQSRVTSNNFFNFPASNSFGMYIQKIIVLMHNIISYGHRGASVTGNQTHIVGHHLVIHPWMYVNILVLHVVVH